MKNVSLILNGFLLIAVAILFVLHFSKPKNNSAKETEEGVPCTGEEFLRLAKKAESGFHTLTLKEHARYLELKRECQNSGFGPVGLSTDWGMEAPRDSGQALPDSLLNPAGTQVKEGPPQPEANPINWGKVVPIIVISGVVLVIIGAIILAIAMDGTSFMGQWGQ